MDRQDLQNLVEIADALDEMGMGREADAITRIVTAQALYTPTFRADQTSPGATGQMQLKRPNEADWMKLMYDYFLKVGFPAEQRAPGSGDGVLRAKMSEMVPSPQNPMLRVPRQSPEFMNDALAKWNRLVKNPTEWGKLQAMAGVPGPASPQQMSAAPNPNAPMMTSNFGGGPG